MNEIHLLSKDERELFFRAATDIKNMPFEIIEKDYWVVWVLERLFSLEKIKPHLTFKGGTSLSKVYGLIDRFSEDIDLSIEREFFGFSAPHDPENAPSKKKQNASIDNLSKACSNYVQTQMLLDLKEAIAAKLEQLKAGIFSQTQKILMLKHYYLNIQATLQKLGTFVRL